MIRAKGSPCPVASRHPCGHAVGCSSGRRESRPQYKRFHCRWTGHARIRDMSDDVTHDQGRSQRCSEGIRLMVEVSADAFADLSTSASLRRPQPLPSDGPSIRVTRSVATDILWGRRSAPPSRAFPRRPGPGAHPRPQRLVGRLHELVVTTGSPNSSQLSTASCPNTW